MQQVRLGVVSFLNTTPLINGLDSIDGISLVPRVPSLLINCLEEGEVDLALASSIDYQESTLDLRILQVGLLSSDGHTLTVRLCSRIPIESVTEVHCDIDSHTSTALLKIIMKDVYGSDIRVIPTDIRQLGKNKSDWPESVLMIGDKVVSEELESSGYAFELDLGNAWKDKTGLPFVFAVWMGKADVPPNIVRVAAMSLDRQRRRNMQRLEQLVSTHASDRGWNETDALAYVEGTMQYAWSDRHIASLQLFFDRACSMEIISSVRPIQYYHWE